MKYVLALAIFLISWAAFGYKVYDESIAQKEVESFIKKFHKNSPQKLRKRSLSFVPAIVHWSKEYEIDPLLTSTIISLESSFIPGSVGAVGEIGLMQLHWRGAKRGFDLSKPEEQIHAGVKHLSKCFELCDDELAKALTAYARGGCNKRYGGLKYRLRAYKRALTTHRIGAEKEILYEIQRALWRLR